MPELTEREKAQRVVAENRKALHDYHILETVEAGLALQGTEVKSIRAGNVNLRVQVENSPEPGRISGIEIVGLKPLI